MERPDAVQRRLERVRLEQRLPARLDSHDVVILDLSGSGAAIEHVRQFSLGFAGVLTFGTNDRLVIVRSRIIRSCLHRVTSGPGATNVYRTGLQFIGFENGTAIHLRAIIDDHVSRLLAARKGGSARGSGGDVAEESPAIAFGDEDGRGALSFVDALTV